jgi:cytidylate kinase
VTKLVREQDQARRRYLRRYFNAEIDEPTLYDLTLNTGRMGFARAAEAIAAGDCRARRKLKGSKSQTIVCSDRSRVKHTLVFGRNL